MRTNKLLMAAVAMPLLMLSARFTHATDACAALDPADVAKSFYEKHRDFASSNPAKIKTLLTDRFFRALSKEYKCAQGEVCAIETDPWTGAQDGKIQKTLDFKPTTQSDTQVTVVFKYRFVLEKGKADDQSASIVLQRNAATECWKIADVIDPTGDSLLNDVEKWHAEYGEKDSAK